ncbi:hypothetical protein KPL70_018434 [Citrus sinensis]|uniref:Uncharacterized protein n=1 Tax=Citrus sinensis TaxID=2711 RepID=A0A067FT90_CITSI|nr:uncharacterized protein LOC102621581 [Citrus sinensis]KAH9674386.1 hypothetical protein KPL70_018434 [Citrus sinensis]KDO70594.1 hypothetical protein CISIN_1g028440mg [Citrus sinensis]GAY32949.1 hypothetical protein CUMW_004910 [Citrus unshiu]
MIGLTKLGTILTVVFVVSVLALVAELLYVLWRRQSFWRRSDQLYPKPSKEQLLYFFCWKNQSRIEPAGNTHAPASEDAEARVSAVDDDDVSKWQWAVYGPSRVLFTIKEEEREGTETTSEAENETVKSKSKTVSFDQAESVSDQVAVLVSVEEAVDEATPFSTPCASPPYYTPSPSPTHDKYSPGNGETELILRGENDLSFVNLEVKNV